MQASVQEKDHFQGKKDVPKDSSKNAKDSKDANETNETNEMERKHKKIKIKE